MAVGKYVYWNSKLYMHVCIYFCIQRPTNEKKCGQVQNKLDKIIIETYTMGKTAT